MQALHPLHQHQQLSELCAFQTISVREEHAIPSTDPQYKMSNVNVGPEKTRAWKTVQ